jgi:hypothetical protein
MNFMKSLLATGSVLSLMNPFDLSNRRPAQRRRKLKSEKTRFHNSEERNRRLANAMRVGDLIQRAIGDLHPATGSVPKTYAVSVRPSKEAYAAAETRYRARMMRRVERWFRANPDSTPDQAPGHLRDWA